MIPKRIFTIWLSTDGVIPPFIQKCIDSQKIEGYEHRLITLENCYKDSKYIKECLDSPYLSKKWCKASDYLRMHYLETEGGIYLDADVEIIPGKNFDHLLHNKAFVGKEQSGELTILCTAVVASEAHHPLLQEWKRTVEERFRGDDELCYESSMDLLNIIGVKYQDQMELLEPDGFYPYNHLTKETNITENSVCIHHFAKTWTESRLDKFANYIKNNINFSFVKRGDGEICCMYNSEGENCDGHPYSKELGDKLRESYQFLETLSEVTIVEFDKQDEYNILLHRTDSNLTNVKNFYNSIIEGNRHCTFIGPDRLLPIANMFGADFVEVPLVNAFSEYDKIKQNIVPRTNEIYIFCAGMISKCLIADLIKQDRQVTCLDAGSAFDPYIGNTRTFQISQDEFKKLYNLEQPTSNFDIPQETHPERIFAIKNTPEGIVFDLGCGTHKTLEDSVGVDIREVTDIKCDIQKLPFGDNNADGIISRHSFEHVLDPIITLKEWIRVLKPMGTMTIVLPDHEFINTMEWVYGRNEHLHAYTRDTFKNLVAMFPELKIVKQKTVLENWSFGTVLKKYPKVSFIIPQLGREEGLKKCIDSIYNLDYPQDRIEIIVEEGMDTVPYKVKSGFEKSTGDYIVYAANDVEFSRDSLKIALEYSRSENKGLVAFNTGELSYDQGNICEHFIIKRDLVYQIGEIFDTRFHHVGVDNFLWKRVSNLGKAGRAEQAIVIHNHFTKGAPYDEIYDKGWKMAEKDRELLSRVI